MHQEEKINFRYSLISSLLYAVFFSIPVIWLGIDLYDYFSAGSISGVFIMSVFFALFTVYAAIIIYKYVVPAFKKNVALEINQQGIIYYPQNVIIEWADITDLRLANNTQGFSTLHCYYSLFNGRESCIKMSLTWVDCDDKDVYGIIEANLEDRKPNWHASGV
jgi:hypothetical protein